MVRVSGCSAPRTRSRMGSSAAYWSRAPAASPASPVQEARLARAVRVSGCSAPRPARGWAAARRTGRGPRPRPPPPRSSRRGWRGWSGCRGARRRGPVRGWAAARRTGRGPRPHPPPAPSSRRGWRGWSGCRGARRPGPARGWAAARRTGRGPRPHPPPAPVQEARLARAVRVSGCSAPETRSTDGQQRGVLVAGPGRIPRLPGPGGEVGAGGQGVGVLGAGDPLADGQQRGVLVAGPGRIPRLPGPGGEVGAGGQGVGVLGAVGGVLLVRGGDLLEQVPGRQVAAAIAQGLRDVATCRRWSGPGRPGRAAAGPCTPASSPAVADRSGIAASIRAAAACCHCPAWSAGRWSRVMAWTRRCTSTSPSPARDTSE